MLLSRFFRSARLVIENQLSESCKTGIDSHQATKKDTRAYLLFVEPAELLESHLSAPRRT